MSKEKDPVIPDEEMERRAEQYRERLKEGGLTIDDLGSALWECGGALIATQETMVKILMTMTRILEHLQSDPESEKKIIQ